MSMSLENAIMNKQYYTGTYSDDQWVVQPYKLEDPKVIGLAYYKGSEYAMYMNPTDKRGYRSIVRLIDNKDMRATLNRDYTFQEHIGLSLVTGIVESVYRKHVPIVQTFKAGNISQAFDEETGTIYIGKAEEASYTHQHIVGIGNPKVAYIADVILDGPNPGVGFDMMGKTPHQPGNDKKVKWKEGDMEKVVTVLKSDIGNSKQIYEELGIVVIS